MLARLAPDEAAREAMACAVGYLPDERRFVAGFAVVAGTNTDIARLWAAHRPDLGAATIEQLLDESVLTASADPVFLFPAVADLLGRLRGIGFRLVVATHDTEAGARAQLAMAGVADAFVFIAGYDSGLYLSLSLVPPRIGRAASPSP